MILPFQFKEIIELRENNHRIVLGELPSPIAPALSNAIRRLVKQSTPGFAIFEVSFENALHQYQRIDHICEDVLEVFQNLKNTKLQLVGEYQIGERAAFQYKFQGPKIVTAKDLCSVSLRVTNPQKHLFEILSNIEISLQIHVEYNTGFKLYSRTENNAYLPIMAIFNPIKGIFCKDVPADSPGYSNIEILLETYGTVDPRKVITQAIYKYYKHLAVFKNLQDEDKITDSLFNNKLLDKSIDILSLSARAYNCLAPLGIVTISDLVSYSYEELLILPNMGHKSLDKLVSQLQIHDLKLSETNHKG
jgi:DNA-directed RNA polymerase subunit alpha